MQAVENGQLGRPEATVPAATWPRLGNTVLVLSASLTDSGRARVLPWISVTTAELAVPGDSASREALSYEIPWERNWHRAAHSALVRMYDSVVHACGLHARASHAWILEFHEILYDAD